MWFEGRLQMIIFQIADAIRPAESAEADGVLRGAGKLLTYLNQADRQRKV
jgi:hypothetical protein